MKTQRSSATVITAVAVALGLSLAGCSGQSDSSADDAGQSSSQENTQGSSSDDSGGDSGDADQKATDKSADLADTEFAVSWKDALDTANDAFDGDLAEIELHWGDSAWEYKIELISSSEEYKVRVNADTGETSREKTEKIDSDDIDEKTSEVVDLDKTVSWDDALKTALDAQDGRVNEWKLEGTSHGPQWQFDIDGESSEDYEVSINAETGELIEVDD